MLKKIIWGPVGGQNTVAGHGVLPPTPLKYFIEHTFLHFKVIKELLNHLVIYKFAIYG